MAAKTSAGAKLITLFILVPMVWLLWTLAPYVLPMWRWQNLDFAALSKQTGIAESELKKEFKLVIRHSPRGGNLADPLPWQIVRCDPPWYEVNQDKHDDETKVMVRCSIISDRDGLPPSKMWVGTAKDDKYLKVTAWRFPPGSFGQNAKRPVIVYQGGSLEKLSIGDGQNLLYECASMESDDEWEDRDDGFKP
jgi:hypothetical protein